MHKCFSIKIWIIYFIKKVKLIAFIDTSGHGLDDLLALTIGAYFSNSFSLSSFNFRRHFLPFKIHFFKKY